MDIYKNLCTQFYDLDKPNAPEAELEFYLKYAKNANGPIYEPMCGTGNFLIPILERGYDITGSDASTHMLSVCLEKCETKSLIPKLHHQFINQIISNEKYALIFIASSSFGLITDIREIQHILKIIYNQLLPGGKFVFDIETIHAVKQDNIGVSQHREVLTKQKDQKIMLETVSKFDSDTQIMETICHYDLVYQDKIIQTEIENIRIRYYHNHEIDEWIRQAGFGSVSCYKAFNRVPAEMNDETIVYECIK